MPGHHGSLGDGVLFRARPDQPEKLLLVSWGIAEFGGRTSIQEAIVLADAAMYERRATRRTAAAVSSSHATIRRDLCDP